MRILGLDYGDARIGVAVSDPLGWTARGITVVSRKNPIDLMASLKTLAEIAAEFQVETVVIGYPKNMDNTEGENCDKVKVFAKKLARILPNTPIEMFDERLTSARAAQVFIEVGLAKSKKRKNVDKMSAALILQGYLDAKNNFKEKIMEKDNVNFDNDDLELELEGDEGEVETIVMIDDDGNEVEYVIIDEFAHEETSYLVMIRAEFVDDDEAEAVIFKQVEVLEDEFVFEEIDEDEYNKLEPMLKARLAEFDIDMQ